MRTLDLRDSSRRLPELPRRTPVLLFVDGVNYAPDEDLTGMFPIDADEIEIFRDRTVLAADGGSFLWVHRARRGEFRASRVHRHVGPSRETTTIASGECTAQDDVSLAADAHLGVTVIAEQHTYRTTKYVAPPDFVLFQEAHLRLDVVGRDGGGKPPHRPPVLHAQAAGGWNPVTAALPRRIPGGVRGSGQRSDRPRILLRRPCP